METLIKELSYLSDAQFGQIVKMCLTYIDDIEYTEEIEPRLKRFFNISVKPRLDKIKRERDRNRKRKEKKA